MARDEEREELAPSKHVYPRDRVWDWRRSEEEEEQTNSSDNQGAPFNSLLGLPRRGEAARERRGAPGRSRGRGGRGRGATSGYVDNISESDSDSREPSFPREEAGSDTSSSSFGV